MTVEELPAGDLRSSTELKDGVVTVRLSGSAEVTATEALGAFFVRVHAATLEAHAKEVRVDLQDLEFMTSACLKTLLTWFDKIQRTPAESQYKVRLQGTKKRPWQSRSLAALSCFSMRLISVDWMD